MRTAMEFIQFKEEALSSFAELHSQRDTARLRSDNYDNIIFSSSNSNNYSIFEQAHYVAAVALSNSPI